MPGESATGIGTPSWIAEIQAVLLSMDEVEGFLQQIAVAAVRALPAAVACGVTLQPDGRARTVGASSPLATRIDQMQYGIDAGPCLQAMRTGEVVYVPDLGGERRWPPVSVAALDLGVRSVLSQPLRGGPTGAVGAMNLYAALPDAFDQTSRAQAAGFAEYAAGAVGLALRLARHLQLTADLKAALVSREIIDQAVGIVMAQQHCRAREAFEVLRRLSQRRNVKLSAVAATIIEGVSGHPPQPSVFKAR